MSSVSGNPEPINFNPAEQIGEVKGQETFARPKNGRIMK